MLRVALSQNHALGWKGNKKSRSNHSGHEQGHPQEIQDKDGAAKATQSSSSDVERTSRRELSLPEFQSALKQCWGRRWREHKNDDFPIF